MKPALNSVALKAIALAITVGGYSFPVHAGTYEALCGAANCTLTVTPQTITTGFATIPTSRVTFWGSLGDSKVSVGTGVATTIVFGPIGLLGFLAKNHEYDFTINGFDSEGRKSSIQVQFKNDKPAKRLMNELPTITGLAMNQSRTAEEILSAEKGEKKLSDLDKATLIPRLDPVDTKKTVLSATTQNCWSSYLESNPAVKEWAEAHPAQAKQNKKRFDQC